MRYLLDTNICIAVLKGKDRELLKRMAAHPPEDFALCSVVKAELLYGARKSQRIEENLKNLRGFFAPFVSLPFDDRSAEHYGLIRAILTREGTPIGANDLLIAATALAADITVLTRNEREFRRVPALTVEVW